MKMEEQLIAGRMALMVALLAAAIAVWQVCFVVRAPSDSAPPVSATTPFRGLTIGRLGWPWQRARSVARRRGRGLQQVLAAGAFGLGRMMLWVMPARDVRPCSVELGDVSAEEECLELTL